MTQFTEKLSHFDLKSWVKFLPKKLGQILVPPATRLLGLKMTQLFLSVH